MQLIRAIQLKFWISSSPVSGERRLAHDQVSGVMPLNSVACQIVSGVMPLNSVAGQIVSGVLSGEYKKSPREAINSQSKQQSTFFFST
jgi:hypothetical protein